ncbi:hypothetical protein DPMN_014792 [Dreissena polymorpha]|uniref:Uncharacterized protein n=2 Tax=Dreissena polymorpha TaxID=45954 RepID=A0A9D4N6N5_DREPO|nr:hypothetical protein DPMN_014792 [Dreissena polymorpha]
MTGKIIALAPVKILGLCLSVIAAVWMLVSLVGRNWVRVSFHYHEDRAWDWSLWNTCNTVEHEHVICVSADWLTVCLVFNMVALILCASGVVCGILGSRPSEAGAHRNCFYIAATGFLVLSTLIEFLVVLIFPIKFGNDIQKTDVIRRWDFDWAYGFAWGGVIFSLGGALCHAVPTERRKCWSSDLTEHVDTAVEDSSPG